MAGFLTGTGDLTYNGIKFPVQISATISLQPVYDAADRGVKYTRHLFSITAIFHDELLPHVPGTLDSDLPLVLEKLQQPGGILIFASKGFGANYTLNTAIQDVAFGPKPRVLEWTPVGNNKSVRLRWQCEVAVLPCVDLVPAVYKNRPISVTYTYTWSLDEAGLTQRTTTGTIEAVGTRTIALDDPPGKVELSADDFRSSFLLGVPLGYTRSRQDYNLSPDHRILTFTIVDTEIPSDNPYYPGILRPSVRVSVGNIGGEISMLNWNMTISGSISTAMGVPRWYAWVAYWMIVEHRVKLIRMRAKLGDPSTGSPSMRPGDVLYISEIHFEEEVFGRSMSFSCRIVFACELASIMHASGLWEQIRYYDSEEDNQNPDDPEGGLDERDPVTHPGNYDPWSTLNWTDYRARMVDNSSESPPLPNTAPWSIRGHRGLRFYATTEDYIIQICDPAYVGFAPADSTPDPVAYSAPNYGIATQDQSSRDYDNTWVTFQTSTELVQCSNNLEHNPLVVPESRRSPGEGIPDPSDDTYPWSLRNTSGFTGTQQAARTYPVIFQRRTQTQYLVHFAGMAVRVRVPVPQIELIRYGGQVPLLIGTRRQWSTKLGYYGPLPVFATWWEAWYSLPMAPLNDTATTSPDVNEIKRTYFPADT